MTFSPVPTNEVQVSDPSTALELDGCKELPPHISNFISSGMEMDQDQEEPASSQSTPSSPTTTITDSTARSILRQVTSFPDLPLLEDKARSNEGVQKKAGRKQRRREVSFDVSYRYSVPSSSKSVVASVRITSTSEQPAEERQDPPAWVPDKEAPSCSQCTSRFTMVRRRHHCRACGGVFCRLCSTNRITIPRMGFTDRSVRVCDHCWVREAEIRYGKRGVPDAATTLSLSSSTVLTSLSVTRRDRSQSTKLSAVEAENAINLPEGTVSDWTLVPAEKNEATTTTTSNSEDEILRRGDDINAGHERKSNE